MGAGYAFALSAPAVLKDATHWTTSTVGLLMSATGIFGALAMVATGAHSDRCRERYLHAVIPLAVQAAAFLVLALCRSPTWAVVAYLASYMGNNAAQPSFWLIPGERLGGRAAAIAFAAIGSIGMLGAFIGPAAWGVARDSSGGYRAGLLFLVLPYLTAASILLLLRHQTLRRSRGAVERRVFG
jgi:ACS family tartrate transporter-like MFS transporter